MLDAWLYGGNELLDAPPFVIGEQGWVPIEDLIDHGSVRMLRWTFDFVHDAIGFCIHRIKICHWSFALSKVVQYGQASRLALSLDIADTACQTTSGTLLFAFVMSLQHQR